MKSSRPEMSKGATSQKLRPMQLTLCTYLVDEQSTKNTKPEVKEYKLGSQQNWSLHHLSWDILHEMEHLVFWMMYIPGNVTTKF